MLTNLARARLKESGMDPEQKDAMEQLLAVRGCAGEAGQRHKNAWESLT